MVQPMDVTIVPTLARMASIYSLSRTGGPRSPRFAAYVADVEHRWGLAACNPMAGDSAPAAVQALLALDAEEVARAAAENVVAQCEWNEPVTLAVVVATPGMWTDRLATEVRHRTIADRRAAHGEILLWATDAHSVGTIARESVAEAVRTMWASLHGQTQSVHSVLAREGMAYALAGAIASSETGAPHPIDARINEAIEVLGDTTAVGDIIGILYGDEAAVTLGYTPLGIPPGAGYDFAISRASELVARVGMARALRSGRIP